jgi:hypothetical protein
MFWSIGRQTLKMILETMQEFYNWKSVRGPNISMISSHLLPVNTPLIISLLPA